MNYLLKFSLLFPLIIVLFACESNNNPFTENARKNTQKKPSQPTTYNTFYSEYWGLEIMAPESFGALSFEKTDSIIIKGSSPGLKLTVWEDRDYSENFYEYPKLSDQSVDSSKVDIDLIDMEYMRDQDIYNKAIRAKYGITPRAGLESRSDKEMIVRFTENSPFAVRRLFLVRKKDLTHSLIILEVQYEDITDDEANSILRGSSVDNAF